MTRNIITKTLVKGSLKQFQEIANIPMPAEPVMLHAFLSMQPLQWSQQHIAMVTTAHPKRPTRNKSGWYMLHERSSLSKKLRQHRKGEV